MALPFNPQSISSLILWLDASDPNSLIRNGTSVIQWRDKSVFQNHTAFSSTTSPIISSINTLSSVYFNSRSGNSQFFQGPLSTFQSTFTGFTSTFYIFAVGTMVSTPVLGFNRSFIELGSNSTIMDGLITCQTTMYQSTLGVFPTVGILDNATTAYVNSLPNRAFLSYGFVRSNVPAYNTPFQSMFALTNQSLAEQISINGSYPTITSNWTLTNRTASRYSIGGNLVGAADARTCWDGHIGEVLIYNPTPPTQFLTMDQIQEVQGYLATKWGIQDQLINSHPYKAPSIFLSTIASGLNTNIGSTSKLFSLPSSGTLASQMVWLQGNNSYFSTATFVPQATESLNYLANSNIQLDSQSQNVLFVNNGNSNWTLHSRFEGDMSNLGYDPYTYFPQVISTIGSNAQGFGYDFAINSNSRYLAVTAPTSNFGAITTAGAVLTYVKNNNSDTWVNTQVIRASDSSIGLQLGTSIKMSYDANYLLVGAASNDIGGVTDVGSAYIFKKDPVSDLWNELQKITVSNNQRNLRLANKGQIAMNQNAQYIALATPFFSTSASVTNAGAVYMFSKDSTTDYWNQTQRITLSYPTIGDNFGSSVALSADGYYLVVGASNGSFLETTGLYGATFVYKKDPISDLWNYVQGLQRNDYYNFGRASGYNVSISGNANYILANGFDTIRSGSYMYKKRTDTDYYDRLQVILPRSNVINTSAFGFTSAISYDGNYFAITADNVGASEVYFYKKIANTDYWTQYPFLFNSATGYGFSLAMDSNCDNFYVAASGGGGRIFPYTQSTMGVVSASNSFINVDTTSQKSMILLPPANSVPGQMIWIKDTKNNASNFPICISTPQNTTLMSNFNGLFFYQNNVSVQLQSDGVSNYNIINYYNGGYTTFSNSVNFIPFTINKDILRPNLVSSAVLRLTVTTGASFAATGNAVTIPATSINSFQNIYFKSFDNQTILPSWTGKMAATSNYIYVNLPYIDMHGPTYYLYWDSNYINNQSPFSTFKFFDDFSFAPGGQPDPNKWRVDLRGSGTSVVQQTTDGFMLLQGAANQNASANIVSRFPFFYGNGGITNIYMFDGFTGWSQTAFNSNAFWFDIGYFCTDTIGTVFSVGAQSTLQDIAGAQIDWSITTLTAGASYYASTSTRHFGFRTSPGVAATAQSNITASYGLSNKWNIFNNVGPRVYEDNDFATQLFSNAPVIQTSSMYLHIGQTSKVGFPNPQLFLSYVAAWDSNSPNPLWGSLNQASIS